MLAERSIERYELSPIRKVAMSRARVRSRALGYVRELSAGNSHYENYRALYMLWCGNNAAVQELRPLFRIPGIEPDGQLRVDEKFRRTVQQIATDILTKFATTKAEDR